MRIVHCGLLVASVVVPLTAHALDAPTGTYKGTLVHERRITLTQTYPPRVVAFKQKTKLLGFGYVPQGGTRTFIRLIVPPHGILDRGVDRQLTVDFTPDPPVFEILDGQAATAYPGATVTVVGDEVTIIASPSSNTVDYELADSNTLTLKRTKP